MAETDGLSRSTTETTMSTEAKCPFHQAAGGGTGNRDWWPDSLRLDLLHQHSSKSDPMGADFDYAAAFRASTSRPSRRTCTR
jgi:catalase (peroxidase I)